MVEYDAAQGFPETPVHKILPFHYFNEAAITKDTDATFVKDNILDKYEDELVDMRPYMIRYPYTIQVHDNLRKAVEMFRHFHLRHLCVTNPGDNTVRGIVTRKDLFKYMWL